MTDDELKVVRYVASELFALAHVERHDSDGTFVAARRTFLSDLAAQLVRVAPPPEKKT